MERVWAMECEAAPDGGIALNMPDHDLYDQFHNALITAKMFGATFGRHQYLDGQTWVTVDMPQGGRVYISTDGGAIRPVRRH
jgi:hypothetical protein